MPQPSTPHKDRAAKGAEAKERAAARKTAKSYAVSEEEFRERVAAHNRENPQRTQRVADKYIAPDGGEPRVTDIMHLPEAERGPTEQGNDPLGDIEIFLGGFVIYPSEHAKIAHVLWIAHTHLMDLWDSTPRIAFLSPEPASGKSRGLEISELLVPRPVEAVNVSVAYLFRKVGDKNGPPTILYDEIDTVFGPKAKENEEIRGLLNAGHRRGAVAGRCVVRGNTIETEEIPAYCAVALAGLGWLPDTILSRSIIIRMRKRKPGEKIKSFRRRECEKQGHALRDRLAHWAARVAPRLAGVWPQMPDGIEDRNADMWEALLAVADAARGDWPTKAREAAVALVTSAREAEPSLGIRLLADLKEIFCDAQEMATEDILQKLHALKESPWNDLRGKPLNDRGLAQRLRQYEIKPKVLGGGAHRGYRREELHDAWERYLVSPPSPDETVTSVTSVTNAEKTNSFKDTPVTGGLAAVTDSAVTHVTDVTLVAGGESGRVCAQCGAGSPDDPPTVKVTNGKAAAWVHAGRCRQFWVESHQEE
jgi:hypothetical protein